MSTFNNERYQSLRTRNDPIYKMLLDYLKNLHSSQEALAELEDEKVVMTVGFTGAGKSTLMNSILQGVENMLFDENG